MIRIIHKLYWVFLKEKHYWGTEEYFVPVSTEFPSQHCSVAQYINRQLPLNNRTRGDVGLI